MFCRLGRKTAMLAGVFGILTFSFVSLSSAVFYAGTAVCIFGMSVVFFSDEAEDMNEKTAAIVAILVTVLSLFAVSFALTGGIGFIVALPLGMAAGMVAYVGARIAQTKDRRYPIALLFITILPFGFLFVEALRYMPLRKKNG